MSNSNQNKPQKPNTHSKTPWDTFVGWVNGDEPEDKVEKPELFAVPEKEADHHDEEIAHETNEKQNDNKQEVHPKQGHFLLKEKFSKFYKVYIVISIIIGCFVVGMLAYSVCNLPPYGNAENPVNNEVSQKYLEDGLEDTGATNAVAGMILDYRAFDTFGESTVLFVAVAAVVMLMKRSMNKKDEDGERLVARETEIDKKDQNLVLKYGAMILVPFVILFGVYVILNGHISPGGGFSGGAIIGGGLMLYALAFGHEKISKVINYRSFTIITGCALLTYAGCKAYSFYTGANHLGGEIPKGIAGVKEAFHQQAAGRSLDVNKVTTLQDNLNQLIPGLAALGLTFLCMYLLKRKVSPIVIILGIFVLAIVLHIIGLL